MEKLKLKQLKKNKSLKSGRKDGIEKPPEGIIIIYKIMCVHGVKRKNRREETVITRMRIGHTGLNKTLFLIGKSGTDKCECGKTETVKHVLMECERYTEERMRLADKLQRLGSME